MPNEADADGSADTEEGGPVKSFLDHLEDLRWTLIKCASAIGLAVLVCLLAGNYVVGILMRPLQRATVKYSGTNQVVTIRLGTNNLTTITLDPAHEELFNLDTNRSAPGFSPADIVGLKSLAGKLKHPSASDGVSQFIASRLSPDTVTLLDAYKFGGGSFFQKAVDYFRAGTNAPLQRALAGDLTRIVQSGVIYDATRFAGVKKMDTNAATQPLEGPALARLNVRLLLAAYPQELSKYHDRFFVVDLVPISGPAGATALGFQVNTNLDAAAEAEHMRTSISALGPAKAFLIGFHVAIYAGIALASPFVFYFLGQFILPALKIREKKYLYRGLCFAVPLFLSGVCFCYFVLLPAALAASQLYSDWFGFSSNIWDAGDYISFVCKFMLGMGLGFELPVVLLVLVKIGLLSYSTLSKARPYMVVINLLLGAILTTPEVFTQVLMAVPLQLLYEISVWIAWYWERKEKKAEQASGNA